MRHGKVESRATHARSRADLLQYVQTRARLGQRGRFVQMSWSTSADHAHFWRIGAARLHALIRNRSAHGHGIQPPASEPRIQMWGALDPHGQHTVPRLLVRNSLHNTVIAALAGIHHQGTMLSPSTHVDLRAPARCAQSQWSSTTAFPTASRSRASRWQTAHVQCDSRLQKCPKWVHAPPATHTFSSIMHREPSAERNPEKAALHHVPFPLTIRLDVIDAAAKTTPRGVNIADPVVENAVHRRYRRQTKERWTVAIQSHRVTLRTGWQCHASKH